MNMTNKEAVQIDPWKLLGWIMDLMVVGVMGFLVFLNTQINDLQNWRFSINSEIMTQSAHNQYAVSVANEFRDLQKEISDVRSEQLKESKIVSTQLAALQVQLENIQLSLKRLELQLDKTSDRVNFAK